MTRLNFDSEISEAREAFSSCGTVLRTALVGSAYITNGSEFNDIDVLLLMGDIKFGASINDVLAPPGWKYGGSNERGCDDGWCSFTKGRVNVIAVDKGREEYYNDWLTAAEVCRMLHDRGIHLDKPTRVAVHGIIMDDLTALDHRDTSAWLQEVATLRCASVEDLLV